MYFDVLFGGPITCGVPAKEVQVLEHLFVCKNAKTCTLISLALDGEGTRPVHTLLLLFAVVILANDDILIFKLELQLERVHNLNIAAALLSNQRSNDCKQTKKHS